MYHERSHGNQDNAHACTAPTTEQRIAQLEAQIAAHQEWLKRDSQHAENERLKADLAEARAELDPINERARQFASESGVTLSELASPAGFVDLLLSELAAAPDSALLEWWIQHSNASLCELDGKGWAIYFGPSPSTPWCATPRAALAAARGVKP